MLELQKKLEKIDENNPNIITQIAKIIKNTKAKITKRALAIILILVSVCLTLISGLIPSRVASKKDPVVALRSV